MGILAGQSLAAGPLGGVAVLRQHGYGIAMIQRHVRDERATREEFGLDGNEQDLPNDGPFVAWCGPGRRHEWFFLDASHCLMSLKYAGSIDPCIGCLRALRDVIDAELHDR